jgi:hypothetical protein
LASFYVFINPGLVFSIFRSPRRPLFWSSLGRQA